jgi:hypothetical protein
MLTKQKIKELLLQDIYQIKFQKKDGSERTMVCTLQEDLLPKLEPKQQENKQIKKQADTNLPVWDLEKSSWRSFCIESVIEYKKINSFSSCNLTK